MENKLFRKASLDRISSPEQLHDYMRVTSPRLWMVLTAILVLAAGFVVYACTANMESTLDLTVKAEFGTLSADLPLSKLDLVKIHMPVRFDGTTGTISNIYQSSRLVLNIVFDSNAPLEDGLYSFEFQDREDLPAGLNDEFLFMMADDGVYSLYENGAPYQEALRRERRVLIEGRLATVTGFQSVDMASIVVSPDNPEYTPADGVYDAQVITESATPISFLFN